MLRPKTGTIITDFEKWGFKKCKGNYGKVNCYYLCVSNGTTMIFVSPQLYEIVKWNEGDPRIHKNPNCRYKNKKTAMDITYDLITAGMLESVII